MLHNLNDLILVQFNDFSKLWNGTVSKFGKEKIGKINILDTFIIKVLKTTI